ncbi:MAG: NADH-quinone oxidoreductase subunit J [Halovenus sp.]
MVLEQLAFGLFAFITLASSLGVVLVRDVWHAALLLGVALTSVAAHYVMLTAEFIAVIQVLVYIGGVLVLLTFAVMLTREEEPDETDGGTLATDESEGTVAEVSR